MTAKSLYFKAAVNAEGQLVALPSDDNTGQATPGLCVFSYEEANTLELQDCRPVIVQVTRAFVTVRDVIAEVA